MRIIVVVFTDWPVDSVVAVSVNQLDIRFYCQCAALAGVIKVMLCLCQRILVMSVLI